MPSVCEKANQSCRLLLATMLGHTFTGRPLLHRMRQATACSAPLCCGTATINILAVCDCSPADPAEHLKVALEHGASRTSPRGSFLISVEDGLKPDQDHARALAWYNNIDKPTTCHAAACVGADLRCFGFRTSRVLIDVRWPYGQPNCGRRIRHRATIRPTLLASRRKPRLMLPLSFQPTMELTSSRERSGTWGGDFAGSAGQT